MRVLLHANARVSCMRVLLNANAPSKYVVISSNQSINQPIKKRSLYDFILHFTYIILKVVSHLSDGASLSEPLSTMPSTVRIHWLI